MLIFYFYFYNMIKYSYRSIFSEAQSKLSNKNPPAFALLQTFPKAKGRTWTTLRNETTLIICVHICPFFIPLFWRRRKYLAEEKKIFDGEKTH